MNRLMTFPETEQKTGSPAPADYSEPGIGNRTFCTGSIAAREKDFSYLRNMLSAVAHEINNSLTPIVGLTSPAMQSLEHSPAVNTTLHSIFSSGCDIAETINKLVSMEKLLQDQEETAASLSKLLESTVSEAEIRGCTVIHEASVPEILLKTDTKRFSILIMYLVSDYKNHMPDKSLPPAISLFARR